MVLELFLAFLLRFYAWLAYKWLRANFLENRKAPDYEDGASNLIES